MKRQICSILAALLISITLPALSIGTNMYQPPRDSLSTSSLPGKYDVQQVLNYVYEGIEPKLGDNVYMMILDSIDSKIKRDDFSQRIKADLFADLCNMAMTEDIKPLADRILPTLTADSLRLKVQAAYERAQKAFSPIWKGQQAPDFSFTDTTGRKFTLKDFRGKTLLIDFWGTWCIPCIEEIPFLTKLQEKYGHQSDFCIISIACDKQEMRWKAYLQKHPSTWNQYLITPEGDKVISEIYYVEGIPRFMIIGKDGRIITCDSMRPSDKNFDEWFSYILSQE